VKQSLQERIETAGMQDHFSDILIPEEDVVELVSGEKKTSKRKFFPGYILVKMELDDETWHLVKDTPKVTGFIGSREKPSPIPDRDVELLKTRIDEGTLKPKPKFKFEVGDHVTIIDGPFTNFDGVIDEVKAEKGKLGLSSVFLDDRPLWNWISFR
jgi:transcriptional antiterminator NusG